MRQLVAWVARRLTRSPSWSNSSGVACVASAQARTSSTLGTLRPVSMREIRGWLVLRRRARSAPLSPARRRSSRSLLPSWRRAPSCINVGQILLQADGASKDEIALAAVEYDILGFLSAKKAPLIVVVQQDGYRFIHEPIVLEPAHNLLHV